jgi:hypothetical protein
VAIAPGALLCDAKELLRAAKDCRHDEVVSLFVGQFLANQGHCVSRNFEFWVDSSTRAVHLAAEKSLHIVFTAAKAAGDWWRARSVIDRLLELRPGDSELRRSCAEIVALTGVNDHLQALPATHSRSLRRSVARLIMDRSDRTFATADGVTTRGKFVGRSQEFGRLQAVWAEVQLGHKRSVLLSGEAGIGKTRLCEHFLRAVAVRGGCALIGRCSVTTQRVPYAVLGQALASGNSSRKVRELRNWILSEIHVAANHITGDGVAWPSQVEQAVYHRLREYIQRLTALVPTVWWLDDLQWSDECSLMQFRLLLEQLEDQPILLLGSYRDGELQPQHAEALQEITLRHQGCSHISLDQMSRDEVWRLYESLEAAPQTTLSAIQKERIYRRVGGRPFFVIELLHDALEGQVTEESSTEQTDWSGLSPRVKGMLEPRFARLTEAERFILAVIAAFATPVSVDLLSFACRCSPRALLDTVASLQRCATVVTNGGQVGVAHELIGSALLASLSHQERIRVHREIARALELRSDTPAGLLALHYGLGDDNAAAFLYHCRAAEQALGMNAFSEARQEVLQAASRARGEAQRNIVMQLDLDRLFRTMEFDEARGVARSLHGWFAGRGDRRNLLRCRAVELFAELGEGSRPLEALTNDLMELADEVQHGDYDETDAAEVLCSALEVIGNYTGGRSVLEGFLPRMRAVAQAMVDNRAGAIVLAACAIGHALFVDARGARTIAREAVRRAEISGSVPARVRAYVAVAATGLAAGDVRNAGTTMELAMNVAEAAGVRQVTRGLYNNWAVILTELGRSREALDVFRKGLVERPSQVRLVTWTNIIFCCLDQGAVDEALQAADKLRVENARFRAPVFDAVVALASGASALAHGDLEHARGCAETIKTLVDAPGATINDRSYFDAYISKVESALGNMLASVARLERSIVECQRTNVPAAMRLEIELAVVLAESDAARSRRALVDLCGRARECGAEMILTQAKRALMSLLKGRARRV